MAKTGSGGEPIEIDFLNAIAKFHSLPFLILSLIIESGQRTVHIGHKVDSGEPVVVKTLLYNEIRVGRIQREINILDSMNSSYFPRVYCKAFISKAIINDYIDNLDMESNATEIEHLRRNPPRPFFVTCEQYVDNIKWEEFARRLSDEAMLVDFLCHLFKALQLLWNNKIVHRDIKPDNILIRPDMRPVVIDLGIAKSLREGTDVFTVPGFSPCTPQYAAPEQLLKNADITHKVDQFAVGVIVYHLLTKTYPYGRYGEIEIEGLLTNFRKGEPKLLTGLNGSVSPRLAAFVHRLLEVEPYKRFRSSDTILSTLSEIRRAYHVDTSPSWSQLSLE